MTRKPPNRRMQSGLLAAAATCFRRGSRTATASTSPCRSRTKSSGSSRSRSELNGYFERQSLLYGDARVVELVASVGRSLAPPPTDDYIEYRFFVLRDPSPNAFALPNGDIYMHTGMLARLSDTAQLAAILGHEVNHVAGHHCIVNFRAANKKIVASMVLTRRSRRPRQRDLDGPRRVDVRLQPRARAGSRRPRRADAAGEPLRRRRRCRRSTASSRATTMASRRACATIWSTHPQLEARAARTREQVAGAPSGRRDTEEFDALVFPLRTMTIRDYIQDDYPRTAVALARESRGALPRAAGARAAHGRRVGRDGAAHGVRRRRAQQPRAHAQREPPRHADAAGAGSAAARRRPRAKPRCARTWAARARPTSARSHSMRISRPPIAGSAKSPSGSASRGAAASAYVDYLRKAPDAADRAVIVAAAAYVARPITNRGDERCCDDF